MIKIKTLFAILFTFLFLTESAVAACDHFYPNKKKIQPFGAVELCNVFFVTQYSEEERKALFSSALLSPGKHDVKRVNSFRSDVRLRNAVKPSDYYRSGYDRGHLVPADDATTFAEMHSTFLMTNMTPQNPKLNRGPWRQLEGEIRKKVENSGKPAIVVTGAIYAKENFMNGVPIPTGYYKILYIDGLKPSAFYAENAERHSLKSVTISWININADIKFPKD